MNIYEAIFNRRSVRKYIMEPVDQDILSKVRKFMDTLTPLNPEGRVEFEIYEQIGSNERFKGLFKADAPYYLLVYCDDSVNGYRNAGYMAEQIVLYMTSKHLGSCYLGSTKIGAQERNGLKQALVIAFGHADGSLYRDAEEAHRLPMSVLCTNKDEPGENMKRILKAARMAPSAVNAQPWRFIVYADRIYVFAKKEMLQKLKIFERMRDFNMGIVLSHIMLGAEEFWMNMETVTEEQYAKKSYKNGEYICTIVFHN